MRKRLEVVAAEAARGPEFARGRTARTRQTQESKQNCEATRP